MVGSKNLVSILGSGVVEAAIEEARDIDSFDGVEGYYTTLETEIAYERGSGLRWFVWLL